MSTPLLAGVDEEAGGSLAGEGGVLSQRVHLPSPLRQLASGLAIRTCVRGRGKRYRLRIVESPAWAHPAKQSGWPSTANTLLPGQGNSLEERSACGELSTHQINQCLLAKAGLCSSVTEDTQKIFAGRELIQHGQSGLKQLRLWADSKSPVWGRRESTGAMPANDTRTGLCWVMFPSASP